MCPHVYEHVFTYLSHIGYGDQRVIGFEGTSEGHLVHPVSRVSNELRPGFNISSAFHSEDRKR